MKMDTNKQGVIDIGTMGRFYNAHKHPKVRTRKELLCFSFWFQFCVSVLFYVFMR